MTSRRFVLSAIIRLFPLVVISLSAQQHCFAQSQAITFEHFNHENGLSAAVTKIAQDSIGFLWLGTNDGLNRFDGKNFVAYRNIPGDTSSLPNNIINDLCVDSNGRVWVATNGGLCYYSFSADRFHSIAFNDTLEKIDRYRVHAVTNARQLNMRPSAQPVKLSDDGRSSFNAGIWFATRTHVHLWTGDQDIISYALYGDEDLTVSYLYEDRHNKLWIGTNSSLYVLDRESESMLSRKVTSPLSVERQLNATVHPIIPYSRDTLLIGSWYGGIHKVLSDGGNIHMIHVPDLVETDQRKDVVRGICHWRDGLYWVGTYGNGLALLDAGNNVFVRHVHADPADDKSLSTDYVFDVFRDVSGILWVGTAQGLDKYDPLTGQFATVPIPSASGEFSIYRLPRSITEDRLNPDYLWLTVSGVGLFHFNRRTHQFQLYQHDTEDAYSLPDNVVHSFYYDHKGRIWVGTVSGLCRFDDRTGKFSRIVLPDNVHQKGVHKILQDSNNVFWFATNHNGIFSYDEVKQTVRAYVHDPADPKSLADNRVFCMLMDRKGFLWIGTQNRGLCRLDATGNTFRFFEHDKNDKNSIPDNGIYDLHEDLSGRLWIATENGLGEMQMDTYTIRNYSTQDGLCNNVIYSIETDTDGNLWLATNNGLSRFDPEGKTFKNYYVHDGLPNNSVSGALFTTSDGTFYIGTSGMLSYFRPTMMKMNRHIPPVVITGFRVFDRPVSISRNGDEIEPIHLSHRDNMITFDFTALNFTNSVFNQYMYKLEGFNDEWMDGGHAQSATFTNLDGGTYIFRVKAANNDGLWNLSGSKVMVIVHPPYWKTWWFYALCLLAVGGILYALYRFRINQLLRLQQIRTRISRDLHDDIGSTLSSINMISSMAAQTLPADKKPAEVFGTISSASRQAMELMSDIVWSINPKNDRMEMIIIRMRQYASEILEAAQIAFTLQVDEASNLVSLPIEHRKDFYLIFKEAINNIAKYSKSNNIAIVLKTTHGRLYLQITDDGIGFDTSVVYAGNGLKNMRARAAELKGDFSISSGAGKGTHIHLSIPVSP